MEVIISKVFSFNYLEEPSSFHSTLVFIIYSNLNY